MRVCSLFAIRHIGTSSRVLKPLSPSSFVSISLSIGMHKEKKKNHYFLHTGVQTQFCGQTPRNHSRTPYSAHAAYFLRAANSFWCRTNLARKCAMVLKSTCTCIQKKMVKTDRYGCAIEQMIQNKWQNCCKYIHSLAPVLLIDWLLISYCADIGHVHRPGPWPASR